MFYSALHFFCNLFVVLHCTALFVTVELFGNFSKADCLGVYFLDIQIIPLSELSSPTLNALKHHLKNPFVSFFR